jgi:predicted amino acid-binding ACT domain protein
MKQETETQRYVVSVLVADRVGVLRDISTAMTHLGANVDGISQTVVKGYFTVILTVTLQEPRPPEALQNAILRAFRPDEASVVVRPCTATVPTPPVSHGHRYILTLTGQDRMGILKTATTFLAAKGINVEDWFVQFQGTLVTHIAEVTLPAKLDVRQVQAEFRQLVAPLGLTCGIQHQNIFRATNEIGPIRRLLTEEPS